VLVETLLYIKVVNVRIASKMKTQKEIIVKSLLYFAFAVVIIVGSQLLFDRFEFIETFILHSSFGLVIGQFLFKVLKMK